MKAKDTVMSWERMRIILHDKTKEHRDSMFKIEAVCKFQADISFKAGVDEGWEQAQAHYGIDTG